MDTAKGLREIASPAYRGFWAESAPILENAAKEIETLNIDRDNLKAEIESLRQQLKESMETTGRAAKWFEEELWTTLQT